MVILGITSAPVDLVGIALMLGWIGWVVAGGVRRHRAGASHRERMAALGRATRTTRR